MPLVGEIRPHKGIHPVYLGMSVFEVLSALEGWTFLQAAEKASSFGMTFSNGTIELEVDFYFCDEEHSSPEIMCVRSPNCSIKGGLPCSGMDIMRFGIETGVQLQITESYDIEGVSIVHAQEGGLHIRQEGGRITEITVYDLT